MPSLDLGAYLERIGWIGEVPVTLETLSRLIRAHMSSIAFENLDVLLDRPVRLDLDAIQDKLVRRRRGGCNPLRSRHRATRIQACALRKHLCLVS